MNQDRRSPHLALASDEPGVWEPALDVFLKRVAAQDALELARFYASLTPASGCPSLVRHRQAALRHDWSPSELVHVERCRRCARTHDNITAGLWHPALTTLAKRLADALSPDDQDAVDGHVEDDGCQRCRRLLRSRWLLDLAGRIGPKVPAVPPVALACVDLPRAVGQFATGTRPPFHLRAVAADGDLVVTLRETDQGQLVVHVEAPHSNDPGQTVRVELLGDGDPVVADVELEIMDGEPGCIGRHAFGPFVELVPQLRPAVAILAVLAEKGSP